MIDEDVDYDLCAISSFTGKYSAVQIILSQYTCKIVFFPRLYQILCLRLINILKSRSLEHNAKGPESDLIFVYDNSY